MGIKILVLLGILYQLGLLLRPDEAFMSRPFFEDSFYTLSVARSLANGQGMSVDGEHLTNGIQPLISLLYVPIFAVTGEDTTLALRLILVLQIAIYALTAFAAGWFMTTLLKTERWHSEIFWLTSAFIVWSYTLTTIMLNGLETGMAIGMAFVVAGFYNRHIGGREEVPPGKLLVLGVLLGLAVLTRIDLGILVAAIILWMFVQAHLKYSKLPFRPRLQMFNRTVRSAFLIGIMSVLVSSPWWIYNYVEFGSLLPISGQSQQTLITETAPNLWATVQVISDAFFLVAHAPPQTALTSYTFAGIGLAVLGLLLLVLFKSGRKTVVGTWQSWREEWGGSRAMPLVIFSGGLVLFYTFFFGAPHFLPRYLVLTRVILTLWIVSLLYTWFRTVATPKTGRRLGIPVMALLIVASGILFTRHFTNEVGNPLIIPARWIEKNARAEDRIGMFQSGTTSFLFPNVHNLDGKVNAEALHALQTGTMPQYVDSVGFDYIIDWDFYTRHVFDDPKVKARYRPIDTLDQDFIVWARIESAATHN